MTCKNLDFDAGKPVQCKERQTKMVSIYENQDPVYLAVLKQQPSQNILNI